MELFGKIVLAVDGSEPSQRAMPVAEDLAQKYSAEVVVTHIREQEMARGGVGASLETPAEAIQLADDIATELKAKGVGARTEVRSAVIGHAAKAIVDVAKDESADLIVMGTRGLTAWSELVLGSVAHKVVYHGPCPVLLVR